VEDIFIGKEFGLSKKTWKKRTFEFVHLWDLGKTESEVV